MVMCNVALVCVRRVCSGVKSCAGGRQDVGRGRLRGMVGWRGEGRRRGDGDEDGDGDGDGGTCKMGLYIHNEGKGEGRFHLALVEFGAHFCCGCAKIWREKIRRTVCATLVLLMLLPHTSPLNPNPNPNPNPMRQRPREL